MAERIVSPGVFTREIEQSFLPAAVGAIGATVIGPTVKGPVLVPTIVSSYGEFVQLYGDTFTSGSGASERSYKYLTSIAAQNYLRYADTLTVVRVTNSNTYSPANSNIVSLGASASNDITNGTFTAFNTSAPYNTGQGPAFKLYTLTDGDILNSGQTIASSNGSGSATDEGINSILVSGSRDNLRWEVSNVNVKKGTFTLLIRRGDDTRQNKIVGEQWNNVTLDPNSPNYIAQLLGDQSFTVVDGSTSSPFLQLSGSYPIRSKYVRVEVLKTTINYLDSNGNVRVPAASASLPAPVSGTFSGGSVSYAHPQNFFDSITDTQSQGLQLASGQGGYSQYTTAINLLSNQDEYDINLITMPGVTNDSTNGSGIVTAAQNMVENRGDCFLVSDPVLYASNIATARAKAEARDSSYNSMYWPWVQLPDADLARNVWVPASTVIPGVYAFNDRVAAPWFAPAGLNRGALDNVIRAERKLTQVNRDDLYESNVNPIATFPNSGVVVYGQKTLQKKASALDRVNVRRLLIAAKKFIASASRFLVFEQNTTVTRNRFLSIVNPYFEDVQQRQGLYAFKVVMDESNNTPDVVDRNQLVGQIFLQPAKTAEFIIIDFNVLPTGATFPGA